MQDEKSKYFPGPEVSVDNLTILARKRIFTPIIGEFYNEFIRNGTNQTLVKILKRIPAEHHPPILHTLTTHVTKEKPVFIYGIGVSVDTNRASFVAASTDLLGCLSLMVDDIIDEDNFRANIKTAWSIYGKQETYRSAEVAFRTLQDLTEEILSPVTRQLLIETVEDSLESLENPVIRNIDSDVDDISRNIDRRARFHCEYPIRALFDGRENEEIISLAIDALFCVNRAGQILNDVKDLIPSQIYGRDLFADVRSGTATIPLVMLRDASTAEERKILRELFNYANLTTKQTNWLQEFIATKLPRKEIYTLILEGYRQFLDKMNKIVTPECFALCQKWVDYKIRQANSLLFEK